MGNGDLVGGIMRDFIQRYNKRFMDAGEFMFGEFLFHIMQPFAGDNGFGGRVYFGIIA